MRITLLLLTFCIVLLALPACSYNSKLNQQNIAITDLSNKIAALEKELADTNAKLTTREAELESIRFELGILRKEVLDLRSPSLNPEQSQTEQLSKLLQELSDPTCDTNKLAFELRKFGKRAVLALMEALKKPDMEYRVRVEKTFSGLLADDATSFLLGALTDPSLRISAAHILSDLKNYSVLEKLNEYLTSDDDDFTFAISETLVKLKDKRGVPTLIDYLKKPDLNKRAIAFNLLNKITGLTLDYKYYGAPSEVLDGAKRWSDWWVKNAPTFIFPTDDKDNNLPSLVK